MASWIGLSLLILLSANAVLSQNAYSDPLIDSHPYLKKCIISTSTNMQLDGEKTIHSGPECLTKTKIQFIVDGNLNGHDITNKQGSQLVNPAKIKYKFGNCPAILVEVDTVSGGALYTIHEPNSNKVHAGPRFEFFLKRHLPSETLDTLFVTHNWNPYFTIKCNIFHKEAGSSDSLLDFEQEVEQGVPDLTLIWQVKVPNSGYFGKAIAKEIIEPIATTTTPAVEKKFPWWIIGVAVGVALALLIILLVVGYLCWRSRRASKLKEAEKSAKSAFGATTQQDQSMYGPSLMKVEQDAKPVDPRAASSIASVAQSPAPN